MGLCLTCVVAGNDLWKTLARFGLVSWNLEGLDIPSIIPQSYALMSIFLQGLQSIDLQLHAPALKVKLPLPGAASLLLDRGTALLGMGATMGWLIVFVAAARQSSSRRAKIWANLPRPSTGEDAHFIPISRP